MVYYLSNTVYVLISQDHDRDDLLVFLLTAWISAMSMKFQSRWLIWPFFCFVFVFSIVDLYSPLKCIWFCFHCTVTCDCPGFLLGFKPRDVLWGKKQKTKLGLKYNFKTYTLWFVCDLKKKKILHNTKGLTEHFHPSQCWCWCHLQACRLARALVLSAYGCLFLFPSLPLEKKGAFVQNKMSALSLLCVQSYIQSYRSTILQS